MDDIIEMFIKWQVQNDVLFYAVLIGRFMSRDRKWCTTKPQAWWIIRMSENRVGEIGAARRMFAHGSTKPCVAVAQLPSVETWRDQYSKKLNRSWDSEREFFRTISSTTFTQCVPEATEFGEIAQNKGHYAVQGHSRWPIFVPIESSCTTSY